MNLNFYPKVICELFRLMLFSSLYDSCWKLLIADDSRYRKCWAGCFIHTPKVICVINLSSLGWFLFSSTVFSCWQILTADDSWYEKKLIGIFGCTLKLICVPNFSSPSWFSISSTVINCHQLLTADENENQPRELKFSIYINSSVYMKIQVNFFSYQLSSDVNSCQ